MLKYDVVAVGNAIVDVIAKVDDSFLNKHNLIKGSMTLIDEIQANNIYNDMPPAREISGGSASNTVAGIASLGGKAAFIGKVKDDSLGNIFTHDLRSVGVEYKTDPSLTGADTARSFIAVTPDAQRTMATYLGATKEIEEDDIDEELIKSSSVTYLEGYLWDEENAKKAMRKAVEYARKYDRKVAFTLSDAFCVDRHREEFIDLIFVGVDIVFANEKEIMSLFETDDLNEAIKKIRRNCDVAAITRSEKGSIIVTKDEQINIDALKNLKVEDTTGAGDLYASGFLYAYTQGESLEKCGKLATLAASEVIQHLGARPEIKLSALLDKVA